MDASFDELLSAAIAKLEEFQASPLHCEENALAMRHLLAARKLMEMRTIDRTARGVEGTKQK